VHGSVVDELRHSRSGALKKAENRGCTSHSLSAGTEKIRAGGWARDGAVQDQIDDSIADAVLSARAGLPSGESETHCLECAEPISERRRRALPGVRTCIECQSLRDAMPKLSAINRRGSKDSQLR
jgi:phage/conjugal plasmid C-4 type zinc finger TraR family protein